MKISLLLFIQYLESIFQSYHALTAQGSPELCIPAPGIYASHQEELGMITHEAFHNGCELPGAVIHVLGPAEGKVEYIPDISMVVLEHDVVPSQESQFGI